MNRCPYCSECHDCQGPSQGWDNFRHLRFCNSCAERRGDEIDYSTDASDSHQAAVARHRSQCKEYDIRMNNMR